MGALARDDTLRMAGGRGDNFRNTDKGSGTLALKHLRTLSENVGVQQSFTKQDAIDALAELGTIRPRGLDEKLANLSNLISRSLNWLEENGYLELEDGHYEFTLGAIAYCEEYEGPDIETPTGPGYNPKPWLEEE